MDDETAMMKSRADVVREKDILKFLKMKINGIEERWRQLGREN